MAFSLWKHIKYFPSTLRRRNLKTHRSPAILDLCLSKTREEKSRDCRDVIVFEKALFCKHCLSTLKRRARLKERFRKAPFSVQISVDSRLTHRNKTAFSNFSGVVWREPWPLPVSYIAQGHSLVSYIAHGYSIRPVLREAMGLTPNRRTRNFFCITWVAEQVELTIRLPSTGKSGCILLISFSWKKPLSPSSNSIQIFPSTSFSSGGAANNDRKVRCT